MNLWVSLGSVLYGNPSPRSPSAGTAGCYENGTSAYNTSAALGGNAVSMATDLYSEYSTEMTTATVTR